MSTAFRVRIINGHDECSLLAAYRRAYGSGRLACSKDRQPMALFLHSLHESVELLQSSSHDDSTTNIMMVIIIFGPLA